MVLGDGVRLAAIGALIGTGLAYAAGRALEALLAGVPASDPLTFGAALGLALLTTLVGCLVPALRAVRVDPTVALRAQA